MTAADLDHTSFAVHDATAWGRRLRRHLGATPIAGEALPEFRYLLLHVGTARDGARIELIEPAGEGFVTRFLDRRGEGPHHITFTVSDLPATVEQVRRLGATGTGENYSHPPWQEAFVAPDRGHGVVVQLAHSDATYPSPAKLLSTTKRDPDSYPSSAGGTDPTWWTPIWDTAVVGEARLGAPTSIHPTSTSRGACSRTSLEPPPAKPPTDSSSAGRAAPSECTPVRHPVSPP